MTPHLFNAPPFLRAHLPPQEYYANTGALKRAAQSARGGAPVGCSIVEAYGKVSEAAARLL